MQVIFADSLAGLFNAAPLLLATKPWCYASWRLVFTIIGFQVSAPVLGLQVSGSLLRLLSPYVYLCFWLPNVGIRRRGALSRSSFQVMAVWLHT